MDGRAVHNGRLYHAYIITIITIIITIIMDRPWIRSTSSSLSRTSYSSWVRTLDTKVPATSTNSPSAAWSARHLKDDVSRGTSTASRRVVGKGSEEANRKGSTRSRYETATMIVFRVLDKYTRRSSTCIMMMMMMVVMMMMMMMQK